jgi:hypothetical protein
VRESHSGETVRDLILTCVDTGSTLYGRRTPFKWLADNGSSHATREALEFAAALALAPCFTPVRGPESNSVSKIFVKTFRQQLSVDCWTFNDPVAYRRFLCCDAKIAHFISRNSIDSMRGPMSSLSAGLCWSPNVDSQPR